MLLPQNDLPLCRQLMLQVGFSSGTWGNLSPLRSPSCYKSLCIVHSNKDSWAAVVPDNSMCKIVLSPRAFWKHFHDCDWHNHSSLLDPLVSEFKTNLFFTFSSGSEEWIYYKYRMQILEISFDEVVERKEFGHFQIHWRNDDSQVGTIDQARLCGWDTFALSSWLWNWFPGLDSTKLSTFLWIRLGVTKSPYPPSGMCPLSERHRGSESLVLSGLVPGRSQSRSPIVVSNPRPFESLEWLLELRNLSINGSLWLSSQSSLWGQGC